MGTPRQQRKAQRTCTQCGGLIRNPERDQLCFKCDKWEQCYVCGERIRGHTPGQVCEGCRNALIGMQRAHKGDRELPQPDREKRIAHYARMASAGREIFGPAGTEDLDDT